MLRLTKFAALSRGATALQSNQYSSLVNKHSLKAILPSIAAKHNQTPGKIHRQLSTAAVVCTAPLRSSHTNFSRHLSPLSSSSPSSSKRFNNKPSRPKASLPRDDEERLAWVTSLYDHDKIGMVKLNNALFGMPLRLDILHRVVVYQRRLWWQGTAKTKLRSEVRGGGRKPHPQKKTGRARAGSIRAPNWRGGGVVHGPIPHDRSIKLPKKVRSLAIRIALSVKYAQGDLVIVDSFESNNFKTKNLDAAIKGHNWDKPIFVTGPSVPENLELAGSNLPYLRVIPCTSINVYDLLHQHTLVICPIGLYYLQERFDPLGEMPEYFFADVEQRQNLVKKLKAALALVQKDKENV